jgi:imidazole glycerol phosphate synthase glutamine amidotransferase subunit
MNVAVIDYGAGNLLSVTNALRELGAEPRIVSTPDAIEGATHLILPGVGAFGDCMRGLADRGFPDAVREWIADDRPFLGICLGYQFLFEGSDESPEIPGLGVFQGRVVRFRDQGLKIPHMGWNAALPTRPENPLWKKLGAEPYFYFVHSYFPQPEDPEIVAATTEYGESFASAVRRGRLIATQFHPEKSQTAGLKLLHAFLAQAL